MRNGVSMSLSTSDQPSVGLPSPSGGDSDSKVAVVAQTARQEAGDVAGGAVDAGKDVAGQAATAAGAVASEAKGQVYELVHKTRHELMDQAETRGHQAAGGLRTLSEQLSALGDGRTNDAGPLPHYLEQVRTRASDLADRLEQGGPQGVLDDVTAFARRRPGLFLVGAVGAGFLVGRLIRSGAASGITEPSPPAQSAFTGSVPRPIASPDRSSAVIGGVDDPGLVVAPAPIAGGPGVVDVSGLP